MWKSWKRSASILFFSPIVGVVGCGRAPLDRVSGAESRDVGAVELASVPADQSLFDIAVDATGVYFAVAWYPEKLSGSAPGSDTAGAVRRVPREGGDTTELWRGQGAAYGVGAGESAIYFITYEYRSNGRAGHVWAVPRTGGTARALGGWGSQGSSIGFAVDGDAVYWGHCAGSGGALNRTDG